MRALSKSGRINAFRLGYDIATSGAIVVSGMAIGVDGVALAGAISAGKPTVAIIGSGIDVCYPKSHQTLAREIVKRGCVLTEYPPKTKPYKPNFPKRNRIIAAISGSTTVVEGKADSGAIITARFAKEYSKDVYAFPGDVGKENSIGCNLLIKNGAKLCTSAEDIISDYERNQPGKLNRFLLTDVMPVDMMSVLRELSVSATVSNDDFFNPPKTKKCNKQNDFEQNSEKAINTDLKSDMSGFDLKVINLYKKISPDEAVLIESLVDEEYSLRDIMRYLLKLEIGGFIKMLPGEKVSRL
jgi:DNA processing protein